MRVRSSPRPGALPPTLLTIRRVGVALTAVLLLFLLVVAILLTNVPRAPVTPTSVASIAEMDAFFERLVASGNPPGLSAAVVQGDDVVYQRSFGFADTPAGERATPDTVYKWWSLTKLLTALAVLQLEEQGRLDRSDEVREYLPFFAPTYAREPAAPVRVEHLLNHSSGLRNLRAEVLEWTHADGTEGRQASELLAESYAQYSTLRARPGRRGYYSNYGYLVLGELIAATSGRGYEDYVVERILRPLGMDRTGFELTGTMREHLAAGFHPLLDFQTFLIPGIGHLDPYIREFDDPRMWFEPYYLDANAYGGAIGSIADATKLLRAFLHEGRLEGRPVLSPGPVRAMLEDGWVPAGRSNVASLSHRRAGMQHGLGWWVFPSSSGNRYQHTGAGPGFATIFRLYPTDGLGIAVLANATSLDREGIADRLYELFRPRNQAGLPETATAP